MMNKMIKKLSAVALAAAMTLSTGVAAQAATLTINKEKSPASKC